MKYLSVCSGIEAASVAWEPLGWTPVGFSEIEPFPSAVLAHRFPGVKNHGDFTTIDPAEVVDADVLVGGTPCQAFSVAGLRGSLDDARGNLTLYFARLANAVDDLRLARGDGPLTIVWENVPGVLNTKDNAFGCFLGALAGHGDALPGQSGTKWPNAGVVCGPRRTIAWRTLDAQHFGLAQRRKRVFVVASAGDWRRSAAVLFEPDGDGGVRPSQRGKNGAAFGRGDEGEVVCLEHGCDWDQCGCYCKDDALCPWCDEWTSGLHYDADKTGYSCCGALVSKICGTLSDGAHMGGGLNGQDAASGRLIVDNKGRVRRLTPMECERLQGFPDNWTLIQWRGKDAGDGPRMKALGNSMAVPVMAYLGRRIEATR